MTDNLAITPAVLVTGSDERGNEFSFFKTGGAWCDCYNETAVTDKFVQDHVFPHVRKVYFSDYVITGDEWVAAGCPMEYTSEQLETLKESAGILQWLESREIPKQLVASTTNAFVVCAEYEDKFSVIRKEDCPNYVGRVRESADVVLQSYIVGTTRHQVADNHESHAWTADGS